jgi:lysophospholipase L1-like esterase
MKRSPIYQTTFGDRTLESSNKLGMTREEKLFSRAAKLAELVLIVGGIVSLLQVAYVLYFYGWTGERKFANPSVGILYYAIPAGLATVLFSALRFSRRARINVALLCLSLFTTVYAGELFLRFTTSTGLSYPVMVNLARAKDKQKEAAKLSKEFNMSIDARTGPEMVDDLRRQGFAAVPIMSPRAIEIRGSEVIPLGAIANKLTVLCNESGSWVTYESDEHGFNNPKGIWASKAVDIVAVGDSFTQGYCVPTEESFVGLLRRRHPAILNLGMAGNGPLVDLAALSEYLPRFKPRFVLWFYFENDLVDLRDERRSTLLMRYLKAGFNQGLFAKQEEIDQALINEIAREKVLDDSRRARKETDNINLFSTLLEFTKLSALRATLGLVEGKSREQLDAASDLHRPIVDLFREILSQAKSRVSASGGTLYFVYLPGNDAYIDMARKERPRILDLVRALGIPLIDIVPAFQAQSDPLSVFPFRGPGHYNKQGHRLVAEEVLKTLFLAVN